MHPLSGKFGHEYINKLIKPFKVPYSGKFSRGPNFRDFRDPRPKRENKNREIRNRENVNT